MKSKQVNSDSESAYMGQGWGSTEDRVQRYKKHVSANDARHAAQERVLMEIKAKELHLKHEAEDMAQRSAHQRRKNRVRHQIITTHSNSVHQQASTSAPHPISGSAWPISAGQNMCLKSKLFRAALQLEFDYFCERRRAKKDQALELSQLEYEEHIRNQRVASWLGEPDKPSMTTRILSFFKPSPGRALSDREAGPRGIQCVVPVKNGRFSLDS